MNKLFAAALICFAFTACTDPKIQEKTLRDEVIKIHDEVMGREEQLMHNKMKLDTLLDEARNDEAKAAINKLHAKLTTADDAMSSWMQKFDPAPENKSHDEIVAYFENQKKQVTAVDSLFVKAIRESGEYLKPFEKQ